MKRHILFFALLFILAMPTLAQDDPAIPWFSIDGGATFSSGGGYMLDGTIGQPGAGTLAGGGYTLSGGFWPGLAQAILPGDCNADTLVDAGDLSALTLEIFDGDGTLPADTPGSTFAGNTVGCNPNGDLVVDAGDLSCEVLTIFEGQGVCEAP